MTKYDDVLITGRKKWKLRSPIEINSGIKTVTVGPQGSGADYETDGIHDEVQIQHAIDTVTNNPPQGDITK